MKFLPGDVVRCVDKYAKPNEVKKVLRQEGDRVWFDNGPNAVSTWLQVDDVEIVSLSSDLKPLDLKYTEPVLSTDSEERKRTPVFSGVLNVYPLAIAAIARHAKRGNDKHNPGQPIHWSRAKSGDHADCMARHLLDLETYNQELQEYEDAVALAMRSLMFLQLLEEKRLNKSPSRGSR